MDISAEDHCRHYGVCGGCQFQEVPYPQQLADKQAQLQELFAAHWPDPIPVTPSPVLWHYRNKVDPSFAPKRYETAPPKDFIRETVLGFKERGRWAHPLELDECRIGPEGIDTLLPAVRDWYRRHDLRAFDSRRHHGFLKSLLIREGKRTGDRMVCLVTMPGAIPAEDFVQTVQAAWPCQSIYHGTTERLADISIADELSLLDGAPVIHEELWIGEGDAARKLRFRISPMSFFQTNTLATERLYGRLRAWVGEISPRILYDLYGGAGGIAFTCADLVDHVFSIENVEAASIDGRANAGLNKIENVTFITEKVEHYLKYKIQEGEGLPEDSAVLIDPPRAGLHPKALKRLIELKPRDIVYVSCNPKLFSRELDVFLEHYALIQLEAVDLFPHTKHVEALGWLRRR
ncbi:MAG: 23S rRNA (uracil(1939)-C(5))-methyltransferase RlmD [Candidatus Hydrogenedentes bacterium]|nr:23S rRNA (uracil(1939)-C(5))-methyltransferase RlmD [Candidatus Hydrogenedentota bacterium]